MNVWRSAVAWQVTIFMVLQAMMSFSVFAWLAPILRERGVDGGTAGLMVSVSIVLQMLGSLFAPALAARFRDQRAINTVVALMTGGGFALSIFGPLELIWVWTGLLGLGQGSLTAVALTMIMLRTRDGHTAAHLSGMMQGVGYGLGSTGTLMVGQLHQATGPSRPPACCSWWWARWPRCSATAPGGTGSSAADARQAAQRRSPPQRGGRGGRTATIR